jgi:hypothetical protein
MRPSGLLQLATACVITLAVACSRGSDADRKTAKRTKANEIAALRLLGKGAGSVRSSCDNATSEKLHAAILPWKYPGLVLGDSLHESVTKLAAAGVKCAWLEAYFETDTAPDIADITKLLGEPDRITPQHGLELDSRWLGVTWYEYGWLQIGAEGTAKPTVSILRVLPNAGFQHTAPARLPPILTMELVADSVLPDVLRQLRLPAGTALRIVAAEHVVATPDDKVDPMHQPGDPGLPTKEVTKLEMTLRYSGSAGRDQPDAADIFFITEWANLDAPEGSFAGPRAILGMWRGSPGASFTGHDSEGSTSGGVTRFSVTSAGGDSVAVSGTIEVRMPLDVHLKPAVVAVVLFKGGKALSAPAWFSLEWRPTK